jgi:hypothetical protein
METQTLLQKVKDSFEQKQIYYGDHTFSQHIESEIGFVKKFKLKWFATQLKVFLSIGIVEDKMITQELIQIYSNEVFEFAVKHNIGIPRGFQSGIGAIAILAGNNIEDGAKQYCRSFSNKRWSAFEVPAILDLGTESIVYFTNKPFWGFIYYPFLRQLLEDQAKVLKDDAISIK